MRVGERGLPGDVLDLRSDVLDHRSDLLRTRLVD
jgi:hypothetical protein